MRAQFFIGQNRTLLSTLKPLVLTVILLISAIVPLAGRALADQVVPAPPGRGWGDDNSAEKMLQMNRPPAVIRRDQPDTRIPVARPGMGQCRVDDDENCAVDEDQPAVSSAAKKSQPTGAATRLMPPAGSTAAQDIGRAH